MRKFDLGTKPIPIKEKYPPKSCLEGTRYAVAYSAQTRSLYVTSIKSSGMFYVYPIERELANFTSISAAASSIPHIIEGIRNGSDWQKQCEFFPEDYELLEIVTALPPAAYTIPKTAMDSIIYAASPDSKKPVFHGMYFGQGMIACCDGHRLATMKVEADCPTDSILPMDFLKVAPSDITVHCEEGKAPSAFSSGNILHIRPVDAVYPNFRQILKSLNTSRTIIVQTSALISLCNMMNKKTPTITFSGQVRGEIKFGEGKRWCGAWTSLDIGELSISCNGHWLKDALKYGKVDSFQFSDASSPIHVSNPETGYDAVIMPVMRKAAV